jgi:hypothetical protein
VDAVPTTGISAVIVPSPEDLTGWPSEALKRRAELVRLIERAERDLLEVEEALERQSDRVGRVK